MICGDSPLSAFIPHRFHRFVSVCFWQYYSWWAKAETPLLFLPLFCRAFLDVLNDLMYGDTSSLWTVSNFCSEMHKLLTVCSSNPLDRPVLVLVCDFLRGLVHAIQGCHEGKLWDFSILSVSTPLPWSSLLNSVYISGDPETGEAEPVQNSYNPSKGAAYYFTSHGNQLRQMPQYNIQGSNSNNDDLPRVDSECKKVFPQVLRFISV